MILLSDQLGFSGRDPLSLPSPFYTPVSPELWILTFYASVVYLLQENCLPVVFKGSLTVQGRFCLMYFGGNLCFGYGAIF